jgi:hypothetical protein
MNAATSKIPVKIHEPYEKIVGFIEGDTFKKKVKRKKHYHERFGAYAIQKSLIRTLQKHNVKFVEIFETDTGNIHKTPLSNFLKYTFERDFGHGPQLFLPLKYFDTKSKFEQLRFFE